MQNKRGGFFWLTLAIFSLAFIFSPVWAEEKKPADDKVAEVNGSVITKSTFDAEMARVEGQLVSMGQAPSTSKLEEVKKEVLETLINRELLRQESRKKKINADDEAVKEQMAMLKKKFPADTEFKNWLNRMGLSEDDLRSRIAEEIIIKELIDSAIGEKIAVSEKEAKDFYDSNPDSFKQPEQIKASHILIKVDEKADESAKAEARKKIGEIQKRLQKGEDFSALAKELSECPSGASGGDLGYFGRGQMVKPFEDAAFALEAGATSDIVETSFGYHLIKSVDRKPASVVPFSEIKERLTQYLSKQKAQKEVALYLSQLKAKATVKWYMK
jgi:peptidyl-prolyl cis-trans isomerase C